MSAMVAPNGSIFHVLPCNNWVDHGFYQFSPTLIFDYYAAVDFEVLESALVSFDGDADSDGIWRIRAAQTGAVGSGSGGALDARTYLLVALVRRRNLSKSHAVPVQSRYAKVTARLSGGPRWFPPYDLQSGSRSDYPIRHFIEIKHFERCEGLSWVVHLKDFAKLADHSDAPIRSPLILLEDGVVLGPPHSSHSIVRSRGGGAYSHWCEQIYMSTPDGSDPNSNGRKYVAVIPHSAR